MKLSLKELINQIKPDDLTSYKKYTPLYIEEAQKRGNWEEWDSDVFQDFFEMAHNSVAYLGQGVLRPHERKRIKNNWMKLAPHLKAIALSQDIPLWDEYQAIRTIIRTCTGRNMRVATNRMLACLQPKLLCTEVDLNKLNRLLDYIQAYTDANVPSYNRKNWERASNILITILHSVYPEWNYLDFAYVPWKLLELFDEGVFHHLKNDYDEIVNPEDIYEGAKKMVVVNSYERNRDARDRCIAAHGCKCSVCGLDFEKMYGELGRGFIHVHHKVPISTIGEEYKLDPENDLIPVCPNCHAMLHRGDDGKVLTIDELKAIIDVNKS